MSERDRGDAPTGELARIVIRAGALGFCVSRVATALRISAQDLAAIQQHIDASSAGRGLGGRDTVVNGDR